MNILEPIETQGDNFLEANSSKEKISISFIIINYNLAKEVENCLNSLIGKLEISQHFKYEVIVIDNNSTDNNLHEVEEKFKNNNIQFYYLNVNVGFGKGCNFGFKKASGDYVCFLNPDTIILEDIFLPIINLFKSNNTIGIIGPMQQIKAPFFDFSAGFFPNIFIELFNLIGIGVFLGGFITFFLTKIKRNSSFEVGWILGAAIFIPSELFQMVNGFDKDYFMFYEEVDLCKRISNIGYKVIYNPSLRIHHIGSVSGKKDYSLYTIRSYASKYIYITKHYKSIYKILMKILLVAQLFSQLIIWTILYLFKKQKAQQKLNGLLYLLTHKLKYEYRN